MGADIIQAIVNGALEGAKGLAAIVLPTFQALFLDEAGTTLNVFGIVVATLTGFGIGFGIFRWIASLIKRRG